MARDLRCPECRQTLLLPPNMRDWLLSREVGSGGGRIRGLPLGAEVEVRFS